MTLGFVGAGLMTFPQSLGVIFGANIGTTVTGWIVALLGVKLQIGTLALPTLLAAALALILGQGTVARIGRVVAGLCLLFIGLDMMKAGLAGFEGWITPERLPDDTWTGRLQLVGIGIAITLVLQSSSAGVAMTLVLLGANAVSFPQAAALVVGMDVGTTVTGLMASLGGVRAMRQVAVANLVFNLGTAAIAFPVLWLLTPVLQDVAAGAGDATALVLFHTALNVTATLMFLPFTAHLAALVLRLVPDLPGAGTSRLDAMLLSDEDAALDATAEVVGALGDTVLRAVAHALQIPPDLRPIATLSVQARPTLAAVQDYLGKLHIPIDKREALDRFRALLHQIDHIDRMLDRTAEIGVIEAVARDPMLRRPARLLCAALAQEGTVGVRATRLARVSALIDRRADRYRTRTLLADQAGRLGVGDLLARTDAMRWLEHVARHGARIAHYRTLA